MAEPKDSYLFWPLVQHRAKMSPGARARTRDIIYNMPWLFPRQAEAEYARTLTKYFQSLIDAFLLFVEPQYNQWVSDFRVDEYPEDLLARTAFINSVQEEIFGNVEEFRTAYLLKKATEIDVFNVTQWGKFTGAVLGADAKTTFIVVQEPWHKQVIDNWIDRNEEVWTNVTREFIHKSTQIVRGGVENGLLWTDTRDKILKVLPKAKVGNRSNLARANLIARDQTAKLNAGLTHRRMNDAALKAYEWLTAGDERVRGNPAGKYPKARHSHFMMNAKVLRWDDNGVISDDKGKTWRPKKGREEPAQAGMAIQCRCTHIPIFRELLSAVDNHIDKNPFLAT
jgi:uncharacterized protein with gpF-like domain